MRDAAQGELMTLTPEAERLYDAFWAAADRLRDDPTVHGMDQPYFDQEMDMVDASGMGIPSQFWEHLAATLALPPRKVWVVLATEDDDSESGQRYLSDVFDTAEKANAYAAIGWAMDVDEAEVH